MTQPQGRGGNSPVASLYVGDLTPDVTEAMLFEKFSKAGPVISVRVCKDRVTQQPMGYAYVNFQRHEDAQCALDALNYEPINGRPCRIMWSQRDPSLRLSGVGNIILNNLESSIDSEALYDTFIAFGKILSCKVATSDEDSSSKGFGFVHFESQQSADLAIKKVNGMLMNGQKVYVSKFSPSKETNEDQGVDERYTNVYVRNFGEDFDSNKLSTTFQKFGKIASAVAMTDETGKCQGFGFVNFEDHDSASKAIKEMQGSLVNGRQIYCAPAQKKKERQYQLMRRRVEKNRKIYYYTTIDSAL